MYLLKRTYHCEYSFLQIGKVLFNFVHSLIHLNSFLLKYLHNIVTNKHEIQAEKLHLIKCFAAQTAVAVFMHFFHRMVIKA